MFHAALPAITTGSFLPKLFTTCIISVASFFTWASREFQINNPVKGVPRPRVPRTARGALQEGGN